jgi:hypothetical protein
MQEMRAAVVTRFCIKEKPVSLDEICKWSKSTNKEGSRLWGGFILQLQAVCVWILDIIVHEQWDDRIVTTVVG